MWALIGYVKPTASSSEPARGSLVHGTVPQTQRWPDVCWLPYAGLLLWGLRLWMYGASRPKLPMSHPTVSYPFVYIFLASSHLIFRLPMRGGGGKCIQVPLFTCAWYARAKGGR